jgi:glutaredoxin 3
MAHLILYQRPNCFFCKKVLNFMNENNFTDIELRDTSESQYKEELVSVGGKNQVPCLFIDEVPLYESSDIIHYLKGLIK